MFDSRLSRWTRNACLAAAAGLTGAAALAQTTITLPPQQQKLIDEAAAQQMEPGEQLTNPLIIMRDKAQADGMLAEPQDDSSGDLRLKMKKDKEHAEMTLIIDDSGGRTVKDKPYSAVAVTETTQTLADGNRIVHQWQNKYYRDTSGRTRREQTFGAPQTATYGKTPETKVFIYDPVAKTHYVLDPGSKTARKLTYNTASLGLIVPDSQHFSQVAQMPPLDEPRDIATEDLGQRTIEGLNCTGKRTTFTIHAGAIGNERPIVITLENWYSNDIEAMVESTTIDPRSGETHYTLQGVTRSEQPISLFEPSSEYTQEGTKQ
jgi:hypothetical protein